MKKTISCIVLFLMAQTKVLAQQRFVDYSSDIICFAPSATALVKTIFEKDRKGFLQLGFSSVTGIALNYGLNVCVRKNRPVMPLNPGWTDNHALPSTHTMAAFDGATFLMRRYGWKWGVPAYVVSTYVAWGRAYTKNHDIWDVLAGAAIGAGSALIYTRPFVRNLDFTIAPVALGDNGAGLYVSLNL